MNTFRVSQIGRRTIAAALAASIGIAGATASAQFPTLSRNVRQYVTVDTAIVALTHVRVIDGTGAPARADQTLILRGGNIAAMGSSASVSVPAGAQIIDLTGKSVIPGLVMVHEHLFYPTGPGVYGNVAESFTRLYLAGGVTSMRTGGNMNGYGEINIAGAIARGEKPGPWIDATGPYLDGAGTGLGQIHVLKNADDARRMVDFWADAGATSFKAYMFISRAELAAAAEEAHKRGMKITGHLCSVTYREAAAAGIDNLEHGFFVATDFVPDKKPDVCPGQGAGMAALAKVDTGSAAFKSLVADLIAHHVAITSTLTVFETFTPGQPMPPGLDVLDPILKQRFEQFYATTQRNTHSIYPVLFAKDRAMELQFARAGGLLIAGTDPTGAGGVIPGYSNQRQVELLAGSGFTPLEAIKICTLNGATFLGRADRVGSIARGKSADIIAVEDDGLADISRYTNVAFVMKSGTVYRSPAH